MRKTAKIILKIAKWGALLATVFLIGSYIWIRGIYSDYMNEEDFEMNTRIIKFAPELPNEFYATLEAVYPNIFSSSFNSHLISEELFSKDRSPCPCNRVVHQAHWAMSNRRVKGAFAPISLTWELEDRVSQKQCFNYYVSNYDFLNQARGIEDAAKVYFNKSIAELTLNEQLEIIVMMKNSSLYNKYRRPELIAEEVEKLKRKMKN